MKEQRKYKKKCRTFIFTDYHMQDWEKYYNDKSKNIIGVAWGDEVGEKKKRPHYQGFIRFKCPRSTYGVREEYKMWCAPMYGSIKENEVYCSKQGKYFELGYFLNQGQSRKFMDAFNDAVEGASVEDIMMNHPKVYCRYRNGLKDICGTVQKNKIPDIRKVDCYMISGPTGIGKTYGIINGCDDLYKISGSNLNWWCGYNGESNLLIDEYNNDVKITELLSLCDVYKLRLSTKGSHTYANWNKVYITTNLQKDEVHINAKEEHKKALWRRVKFVNMSEGDELELEQTGLKVIKKP